MIPRRLESVLKGAARHYPVVTVTGPRQSGKTTLCRKAFPDRAYVSFERLDDRERARSDPRGLLDELREGAVLDEIQHVPGLLSYLQAEVDERPAPGRFILTGSQHLGLHASVSQSLAGRTAVLHLLPPDLEELHRFARPPRDLMATLLAGAYPRIHDRGIPAERWLADYVATYVQRDVRQILRVGDLQAFTTFLRLAAGRTGQEVNLSSLGADCGVSHNTVRAWLSVLEAGFLVMRVPPWHRNAGQRAVKAAKLHWYDSGLVCHLLGIGDREQLLHHPLRGAIFESWVAAEAAKHFAHRGLVGGLHHLRRTRGLEVDLVVENGRRLVAVESKSGATPGDAFLAPLLSFREEALAAGDADAVDPCVVYGGDAAQTRSGVRFVPWNRVARLNWSGRGDGP